jgi:hypothetical protein
MMPRHSWTTSPLSPSQILNARIRVRIHLRTHDSGITGGVDTVPRPRSRNDFGLLSILLPRLRVMRPLQLDLQALGRLFHSASGRLKERRGLSTRRLGKHYFKLLGERTCHLWKDHVVGTSVRPRAHSVSSLPYTRPANDQNAQLATSTSLPLLL